MTQIIQGQEEHALEILSDILLNSQLSDTAVSSERGVILRESEEVNKNMEENVLDRLHEVAFEGGLSYTILGPDVSDEYIQIYTPARVHTYTYIYIYMPVHVYAHII